MDKTYCEFTGFYRCRKDTLLTLDAATSQISSIVGYSPDEIRTEFDNSLINLILPGDRETVLAKLTEQLALTGTAELSFRIQHKDGRILWVVSKNKVNTTDDGSEYLTGVLMDVTLTHELHSYSESILNRYQIILSQTENIIFEYDIATDTIFLSDTWEKIFGYTPSTQDFMRTLTAVSHMHDDDIPVLVERFKFLQATATTYQTMEARIQKENGDYIWTRIRATALRDESGTITKLVGIIINIDAEKRAANALQERAERDALTKLLNKEMGRKQTMDYLNTSPGNVTCSLLIIDLDNFKQINDLHGHMFGDQVLVRVAAEIKKIFRSGDIVARIGGDEFMVLMKGTACRSLVEKRCNELIHILTSTRSAHLNDTDLSCSVGVAFAPAHGTTYHSLFVKADHALYEAKAKGKGCYIIYDENDA